MYHTTKITLHPLARYILDRTIIHLPSTTPYYTVNHTVLHRQQHRRLVLKLIKVQEKGKRLPPVHMLSRRIQQMSQEKMNHLLPSLEVI